MADRMDMRVQRQVPIRTQVASILRDAIVDMRLAPGQLLIERQLCEMTDASRPSVREALRQLEAEGLVESQNGRGTFVTVISPEVAQHVYVVRTELEGLAAELFAEHASEADREAFRQAVGQVGELIRGTDPSDGRTSSILEAKNEMYDILFRGATGWTYLPAGTSGFFLKTQGAGAEDRQSHRRAPAQSERLDQEVVSLLGGEAAHGQQPHRARLGRRRREYSVRCIPFARWQQRRPERLRLGPHEAVRPDLFELSTIAAVEQAIVAPIVGDQNLRRARRHIRVSAKDRRA